MHYGAYGNIVNEYGDQPKDDFRANTKKQVYGELINDGKRHRNPSLARFLQPDPLEYIDGLNVYLYCGNNPWGRFDPEGLDAYVANRQLGGSKPVSLSALLSHTFTFTTKNEKLENTYSWGTRYINGKGVWEKNNESDVAAANEILEKTNKNKNANVLKSRGVSYALKEGDEKLDKHVDDSFDKLKNSESSDHKWEIFNNCKTENNKLINEALKNQKNEEKDSKKEECSDSSSKDENSKDVDASSEKIEKTTRQSNTQKNKINES